MHPPTHISSTTIITTAPPSPPPTHTHTPPPPGRRLLLDMGTSHFSTSLALLLNQYKALGIEFDEIWAWEVNKIEPESYWAEVPPTIKPRLHVSGTGVGGWVGSTGGRGGDPPQLRTSQQR